MSWLTKCLGPEGTASSSCLCLSPRAPYPWPRTPFQPLQDHQSLPQWHHSRAYFQLPMALTCLSMGLTKPSLPQDPQPSPPLARPHGPAQSSWGCVWPWFLSSGLILTPACGLMPHLASWPLKTHDKDSFISVLSHSVLATVRSLKFSPPYFIFTITFGFPPHFIKRWLQFWDLIDFFLENHHTSCVWSRPGKYLLYFITALPFTHTDCIGQSIICYFVALILQLPVTVHKLYIEFARPQDWGTSSLLCLDFSWPTCNCNFLIFFLN